MQATITATIIPQIAALTLEAAASDVCQKAHLYAAGTAYLGLPPQS